MTLYAWRFVRMHHSLMTAKRQALFVYIPRGHHLSHVKMLHELGVLVDLITTREFVEKLKVDASDLSVAIHYLGDALKSPSRAFQRLREFTAENQRYDEIITTSLDEMWQPLLSRSFLRQNPMPAGVALSGIWIGANFIYRGNSDLKRLVCECILKRICRSLVGGGGRVLFFNETLRELMVTKMPELIAYLIVCPDPYQGEVRLVDDDILAEDAEVPTLLMAGYHTQRKGTLWALQALAKWSGPSISVVIAGVCEDADALNDAIGRLPETVEVDCMNRWVDDEELSFLYRSARAVLLPYRRFGGSSGVFVNALAHRCPVIVPDWGVISERTREYNLGLIFEHDSKASFLAAIGKALSSILEDRRGGGLDIYLEKNSPKAYIGCLLQSG